MDLVQRAIDRADKAEIDRFRSRRILPDAASSRKLRCSSTSGLAWREPERRPYQFLVEALPCRGSRSFDRCLRIPIDGDNNGWQVDVRSDSDGRIASGSEVHRRGKVGRHASNLDDVFAASQRYDLRRRGRWPPNQEGCRLHICARQGAKRIGFENARQRAVFGCKAHFDGKGAGPGDPARHVMVEHRAGRPMAAPGTPQLRDGSSKDGRIALAAY
ncbi:hypothetical protein ABH991_008480 [Bradyrhizobium ottawaense]|uniref:Uncharacterized protein n=1 Tax=Bradyrhizobium ottawaense TaxID=931866 RepID=A0ABV4FHK5_9BRAD